MFALWHDVVCTCLSVEILSCTIRSDHSIVVIIKFTQCTDDTTFAKDGFSLGRLIELLNKFKECSGLKINPTKQSGLEQNREEVIL